jgi:hypothetical protein
MCLRTRRHDVTTAKPCSVLTYLPTGNPLGLRTAIIRGQTCRVSVAPPGAALELERFQPKGPVVALTWRERERPLFSVSPDVEDLGTTFRHADFDVSVGLVSNDQDFLPTAAFEVLAEVLATRAEAEMGARRVAAEPWSRCLGETMAETAAILLALHRVPGFC